MQVYDSKGLKKVPTAGGGLAAAIQSISAGTTQITSGQVIFGNANGITFGVDGQTITASHNGLTNLRFSAGTTSNLRSDITFGNANGVSFGLDNGTITASIATSLTNIRLSAGTTSNLASAFTFSNSNGISFGLNAGTITASVATSLTNINISAGTTSQNLSNFVFSNSNGISFGLNGSTVTASYTVPTQSVQTLGIYALNNTIGASSSSTYDARSLSIDFQGIISGGWTNGSLRLSVPSGGGGLTNINISAGTTSQNLSNLVFSNSNGVTFGLNGSTITASVAAGGGGGGTVSGIFPEHLWMTRSYGQLGNASVALVPHIQRVEAHIERAILGISFAISSSSNSSHAGVMSFRVGIYTRNGNSFSLASSGSTAYQWSNTSNNSTSVLVGPRHLSVPINATLTPGHYWIAIWSRTSTTNANWFTASNQALSLESNVYSGSFMQATNTTNPWIVGLGRWTASSADLPSSIAVTAITHAALRTVVPIVYFTSGGTTN